MGPRRAVDTPHGQQTPGTLLAGISTTDPWVFALAPAVMFASAVMAALVPALRAAAVDPTRALGAE